MSQDTFRDFGLLPDAPRAFKAPKLKSSSKDSEEQVLRLSGIAKVSEGISRSHKYHQKP